MFCPRCGRAVNENANFCGGCGLSRVEIEKYVAASAAQPAAEAPKTEPAAEVPFGTIVNEPAQNTAQPAENAAASDADKVLSQPAEETATAKTTAAEPAKAEEPKAETGYSYTAPKGAEYHYSVADGSYQNVTQSNTQYTYGQQTHTQHSSTGGYTQPVSAKNENLSTVDFVWMLLISSIPVVGLIYLIYLAIQDNNTNKRSYARATLIISAFAIAVSVVFLLGFVIAGL